MDSDPCYYLEEWSDLRNRNKFEDDIVVRKEASWEKVLKQMDFNSNVKCSASLIYRKLSKLCKKSSIELLFYAIYCALNSIGTPTDLLTLSSKFKFSIDKAKNIVRYCLPLAVCKPPMFIPNPFNYLRIYYQTLINNNIKLVSIKSGKKIDRNKFIKELDFEEMECVLSIALSNRESTVLERSPELISLLTVNEYLELFSVEIFDFNELYCKLPFEIESKISKFIEKNKETKK